MKRPKVSVLVFCFMSLILTIPASAQNEKNSARDIDNVIPLRKQATIMAGWWQKKRETVLPGLMQKQKIDLWIVSDSEKAYYQTLIPTNFEGHTSATPSYILYQWQDAGVEYLEAEDIKTIAAKIKDLGPQRIAVSAKTREELSPYLDKQFISQMQSPYTLGVRWIETQLDEQISTYRHAAGVTHDLIAEAFSNLVITPDVTTTGDVKWYLIQRALELGLDMHSPPSITHYRSQLEIPKYDDPPDHFGPERQEDGVNTIIRRGDIIRFDYELKYLGIGVDTHEAAYVLKEGETDVPQGLKDAILAANRVHDITIEEFRAGRSGDEMYQAAQSRAEAEGYNTKVIVHPVLYYNLVLNHGHPFLARNLFGAGLSLNSDGGTGEDWHGRHTLHPSTVYALEPYTMVTIPEWGDQVIELGLGEVSVFSGDKLHYIDGRQTEWFVIK